MLVTEVDAMVEYWKMTLSSLELSVLARSIHVKRWVRHFSAAVATSSASEVKVTFDPVEVKLDPTLEEEGFFISL